MANVPYTPYPTADPSTANTPGVQVNAPADAFGAGIASAIGGLGKQLERSSDEIFQRAVAIQELRNDAEAREADTKYMMAAGELHAKYNALQGDDAVKAYPQYAKDLEDTRVQLRETLSNDRVKKLYDGSSRSTMGRSIFNGAGHAATENKKYLVNTAKAQADLDAKEIADNPTDERLFQEKLRKIEDNARVIAGVQGFEEGSPTEELLIKSAKSKAWQQRIIGLSRTDPIKAAEWLDKNKTQMVEDDFLRADNTVRTQARSIESVNIANEVYNDTDSLKVMEAKALELAKQRSEDPILHRQAVAAVQGKYNQAKYATRQEDLVNINTVNEAILRGTKDVQQLRADPRVAAAMDAAPKDFQLSVPKKINSFNAAKNKTDNEDQYWKLRGRASNDVEAFLNTDITGENISQQQMKELIKLQDKLKENVNQDPRVDRAKGIMRSVFPRELEALKIFKRTEQNKDDFDHYTGALQAAIDVWQLENKKPPSARDIQETIGPQVIQQESVPATLFGLPLSDTPGKLFGITFTDKEPFYKREIPQAFKDSFTAEVIAKGGEAPDDIQIRKGYNRTEFMKLYGKPRPTE